MSRFHIDPEQVILERRKREGQFNLKSKELHWGEVIAEELIKTNPNPKNGIYTCAAGITPSGMVHFGNFREIMTNWPVLEALKARGKKARLIFSWDDFDRFRKVPSNVPENYTQYLGLPVSKVPSPENPDETYAEHFKKASEEVIKEMGLDIEFKHQGKLYPTGQYAELISKALNQRAKIADILWAFMSEKSQATKGSQNEYRSNYWPGVVYSSFTGKDNTEILEFDGEFSITYKCLDTDKTETIDIREQSQFKLGWKIDWPMRWAFEGVNFEPGGVDHSTYGGSFDVASVIAKEIFQIAPPFYQAYGFINIKGNEGKMSSSKGNALTPKELLEVYELPILKWVYTRSMPKKEFELAFDSDLIRLYDEYDRTVAKIDSIDGSKANGLKLAINGIDQDRLEKPASFRQLTGWAQIADWNEEKLKQLFTQQDLEFNPSSITIRLEKAKNWMEKYNQEELLELLEEKNTQYIETMTEERKSRVRAIRSFLQNQIDLKIDDINHKMYQIPKDGNENIELEEKKSRQKDFFKDIYMLLLNKERGPRLSTFLWALNRKNVILLLDI